MRINFLIIGLNVLIGGQTLAADSAWLLFNENSLTYQEGNNYRVGDPQRNYWTFEHISVWTWGDVFFFRDWIREKDATENSYYMELSPRLSLGYLTDAKLSTGPIQDVFLTTTFEQGSHDFNSQLFGLGLNWTIPGFTHFESNLYHRDTDHLAGNTWQITLAWSAPFSLGKFDFLFDGYLDTRGEEGFARRDFNFNPQLKLDWGKFLGWPGHLYSGIEYYYWNNKFGIEGVNERNISALIQMRFSL